MLVLHNWYCTIENRVSEGKLAKTLQSLLAMRLIALRKKNGMECRAQFEEAILPEILF